MSIMMMYIHRIYVPAHHHSCAPSIAQHMHTLHIIIIVIVRLLLYVYTSTARAVCLSQPDSLPACAGDDDGFTFFLWRARELVMRLMVFV